MIREEDLPGVNACLNGLSAILLIAGFLCIRRRWVAAHVACMLTALAVSACFLVSYLYYHIGIKKGEPTRFSGEDWERSLYLTVLSSHTVLAVVAAPLAIYTAYLGLRGKFLRHVRLAWWTFPIWLYVSITGVIVYWMLYHLYPQQQ